jgi:hypothetical protein
MSLTTKPICRISPNSLLMVQPPLCSWDFRGSDVCLSLGYQLAP